MKFFRSDSFKIKIPDPQQLPTTDNELQQHVSVKPMDEALLTIPDKLSPADSEWKIFDISQTQWMEKLSASKSILEKMKCDCHKSVCLDLPQC